MTDPMSGDSVAEFCVWVQRLADETQAKIDAACREAGFDPESFPSLTIGWTARRPGEPT